MTRTRSYALLFGLTIAITGCPGDDGGTTGADTSMTPTGGGTVTPETTGGTAVDGTAGSDETGSPPPAMVCTHQCSGDGDCTVSGVDVDFVCDGGTCRGPQNSCTSDNVCVADSSGWSVACTSGGAECEASQVCVDLGDGVGRCGPSAAAVNCQANGFQEIPVLDIDGLMATVCGRLNAKCGADGVCFNTCNSDMDCVSNVTPVCNSDSMRCECGSDADCQTLGQPERSVCAGGTCGCGTDEQCQIAGLGDVCGAGVCGCSGDDACADAMSQFDGGSIVCAGA